MDPVVFVAVLVVFCVVTGGTIATSRVVPSARHQGQLHGLVSPDEQPLSAMVSTPALPPRAASPSLTQRFRDVLVRSSEAMQLRFDVLFRGTFDEAMLDDLEDTLLMADVGVPTTERLLTRVRDAAELDADATALREVLRAELRDILEQVHSPLEFPVGTSPWVILVVGVNGSGKTTTIGKLAARLKAEGKSVLLAAGDTYRAAASEQLAIWAERAGADFVGHQEGADPGAVVFDALEAALARHADVVLIDTAGRLQTKKPLMEQLSKIRRVITKKVPEGPHETLLVIDGTMGQNAMSQAKLFNEATPLTGVAITKLDGTAKGGVVLAIAAELALPVKLVGIGEQVDDLRDFEVDAFVEVIA